MEKNDILRELLSHLYSEPDYVQLTVQGQFTIPKMVVNIALSSFLEGDNRGLFEYGKIWSLSWESDDRRHYGSSASEEDVDLWHYLMSSDAFWELETVISKEQIQKIDNMMDSTKKHLEYLQSYTYRRKVAALYTSNKKVREAIFNRDGKICKHCMATTNLSLDHIKPISIGGDDTLENLQVLCKSCNSKKGNKYNV